MDVWFAYIYNKIWDPQKPKIERCSCFCLVKYTDIVTLKYVRLVSTLHCSLVCQINRNRQGRATNKMDVCVAFPAGLSFLSSKDGL